MSILPGGPAARRSRRGAWRVALTVGIAAAFSACSDPPSPAGPNAERGRQIYLAQCIACHNSNPAVAGPVGPPVQGSSRELLEGKVLKGAYPPGYTPKRPTTLMPAQLALGGEIDNLAAFLK
jgi:mono/diheme cytochrome c family protein